MNDFKVRNTVIATRVLNFETKDDKGNIDKVDGTQVFFLRKPSQHEVELGWHEVIVDKFFIPRKRRQEYPSFMHVPVECDFYYEPEGMKLRLVKVIEVKPTPVTN